MNRKAKNKQAEPLTWREVGIVATVCCLLILVLAVVGDTLPASFGLIAIVGGVPLFAYLWQRTVNQAKTAPPLSRGQWLWNAVVFLAFVSVIGALIWAWRWHAEWRIWHWGESTNQVPVQSPEKLGEHDEPAGPIRLAKP